MDKIVKSAKNLGIALGVAGSIVSSTAYADISYNNAEYTKAVVKNFESNKEGKTEKTIPFVSTEKDKADPIVADFNENKTQKKAISLDVVGGDNPPLKIGNITINHSNVATSLINKLGIYDGTAVRFARNIETIRNSEYQAQYTKVIKVIDGFVANKKISAKQGWAVLLKITNGKMFDQSFKSNAGMGKLFVDATNRDKDVKAFYQAGNLTSTNGRFNPKAFDALLAYAANMETRSGYSANVSNPKTTAKVETEDDDDWGEDISFGDATIEDLENKITILKAKTKKSNELTKEIEELEAQLKALKK